MKNISVLIVDDSEIDRYILTRQLKDIGVTYIFEEKDGSTALSFFEAFDDNKHIYGEKFPPVLIFLDINMPFVGGFDFLEKFAELRKHLDLSTCVIMMYSSSEQESDKLKAFEYSFVQDYLVKGQIKKEDLREKLTAFL